MIKRSLFFIIQYFFYGTAIFQQFQTFILRSDSILSVLARYHTFICFSMMMGCLLAFVGTLEKTKYLEQFKYLNWTIMTLLLIIPSNFHIFNILHGLFWLVLYSLVEFIFLIILYL